jgi:hypothetical protein
MNDYEHFISVVERIGEETANTGAINSVVTVFGKFI